MVGENLLTVFVSIVTDIEVVTLFVVVVVTAGVTLPESEDTGTVVISCDEDLEGVVVNKDVVPVDDVPVGDDTFANVDVIADRGNPVGSDVDSVADGTVDDIVDAEVYDGSVEDVVVEVVVVDVVLPEQLYNLTSSMAISLM